jgi:hypothetical protein
MVILSAPTCKLNKSVELFVSLDKNYAPYFSKYSEYFGRALRLVKGIYGLTISGKLWAIEFLQWLISQDFITCPAVEDMRAANFLGLPIHQERYLLYDHDASFTPQVQQVPGH